MNKTNLVIGSDHRGFNHKQYIFSNLSNKGLNIKDVGCYGQDSIDYPDIVAKLVREMNKNLENSLGLLICGSGIGVSIAANRFPFIRAALVYTKQIAQYSRNHNDANVIALGADFISKEESLEFVNIFLNSHFESGRHKLRVDLLGTMKLD